MAEVGCVDYSRLMRLPDKTVAPASDSKFGWPAHCQRDARPGSAGLQPAPGVADRWSAVDKPSDGAGSPADSSGCKPDSPGAGCKPALPGALRRLPVATGQIWNCWASGWPLARTDGPDVKWNGYNLLLACSVGNFRRRLRQPHGSGRSRQAVDPRPEQPPGINVQYLDGSVFVMLG